MLIWGRHLEVGNYVQERVGTKIYPPFTTLGIVNDGDRITAGIVFNCWTGPDVELTIANDGGMHRQLINATAAYVYNDLKCVRCSITVRKSDQKTYETALKFGFTVEGVKRRGFGDEDAVIMGMMRDECRWIRK